MDPQNVIAYQLLSRAGITQVVRRIYQNSYKKGRFIRKSMELCCKDATNRAAKRTLLQGNKDLLRIFWNSVYVVY